MPPIHPGRPLRLGERTPDPLALAERQKSHVRVKILMHGPGYRFPGKLTVPHRTSYRTSGPPGLAEGAFHHRFAQPNGDPGHIPGEVSRRLPRFNRHRSCLPRNREMGLCASLHRDRKGQGGRRSPKASSIRGGHLAPEGFQPAGGVDSDERTGQKGRNISQRSNGVVPLPPHGLGGSPGAGPAEREPLPAQHRDGRDPGFGTETPRQPHLELRASPWQALAAQGKLRVKASRRPDPQTSPDPTDSQTPCTHASLTLYNSVS